MFGLISWTFLNYFQVYRVRQKSGAATNFVILNGTPHFFCYFRIPHQILRPLYVKYHISKIYRFRVIKENSKGTSKAPRRLNKLRFDIFQFQEKSSATPEKCLQSCMTSILDNLLISNGMPQFSQRHRVQNPKIYNFC